MSADLRKLRNIGIAAHIDAGKTTTTERILYYTGRTYKMGEVDEGTTVTDFDKEEQQRGITIYSAAVTCPWRDHTINLIDTPGHVDFTAEVERSLRVLDGAIAIFDAKEGVEAQSETVWHQADKYHVPRMCFINKMDKVGADFEASFQSVRERLAANPVAVQIPIGAEMQFQGLIDLISMKAVYYQTEQLGSRFEERPIPPELEEQARKWRHELEERVAETCEPLMEKFIHDVPLENDELRAALRAATIAVQLQPVFCGSALNYIGVQRLLDGVIDYLPSPLDLPPVKGIASAAASGKKTVREAEPVDVVCDPKGPLVGYVFKIVGEKPMDIHFVRVYSGALKSGSRVYNPGRDRKENISRLFRVFAKKREAIEAALAGDIVAVAGLRESITGDTICDARQPVLLERIQFPETVISMSIEPRSSADREKLIEELTMLARENPTFTYRVNEETGQTLISGMGELHLEVIVNRLRRDRKVDVRVYPPQVSYRETITTAAEHEEEFRPAFAAAAGRAQYAKVRLLVEPLGRDSHLAGGGQGEGIPAGEGARPLTSHSDVKGRQDSRTSGRTSGTGEGARRDSRTSDSRTGDSRTGDSRGGGVSGPAAAGPPVGRPPESIHIENRIPEGTIREEFLQAALNGVRDAAGTGVVAGYPMLNLKVTLLSAAEHPEDSSEQAFEAAARIAFDKAAGAAAPVLMEPIMKAQIIVPESYFGTVSGDLARRRGEVQATTQRGDRRVIDALVPLKEMFGYATDLRSLTQGRGSWTMEPSHYAPTPGGGR